MDVATAQLALAAIAYAIGGVCMKLSAGFARPLPSLMLFVLFAIGATLQTWGMRRADLGVAYIMVLGLEAIVALVLSIVFLGESSSVSRIAAVALVIVGIIWLRQT
jgi:multidrug transporter EmrE-like cation transporter